MPNERQGRICTLLPPKRQPGIDLVVEPPRIYDHPVVVEDSRLAPNERMVAGVEDVLSRSIYAGCRMAFTANKASNSDSIILATSLSVLFLAVADVLAGAKCDPPTRG